MSKGELRPLRVRRLAAEASAGARAPVGGPRRSDVRIDVLNEKNNSYATTVSGGQGMQVGREFKRTGENYKGHTTFRGQPCEGPLHSVLASLC